VRNVEIVKYKLSTGLKNALDLAKDVEVFFGGAEVSKGGEERKGRGKVIAGEQVGDIPDVAAHEGKVGTRGSVEQGCGDARRAKIEPYGGNSEVGKSSGMPALATTTIENWTCEGA